MTALQAVQEGTESLVKDSICMSHRVSRNETNKDDSKQYREMDLKQSRIVKNWDEKFSPSDLEMPRGKQKY